MFIKWSSGDQPCLAKCVVDGQTHGRPFFQVGLRHGNPLFSFSLFSSICGYKIWELPFLPHLFSAFCRFRKKKELFWEMVAFFRWLPAFFRMFGCCIFQLLDSTFFFGRSPNAVMQHCQFLYLKHTEEAFRLRRLKQWQYAVKNPRCVAGIGAIVFRRRGQIKIQVVAVDAVKQEKWNEHYPHSPFFFGFAIFCVCAFFLLCFWQIHQAFWFSLSSVFSFLLFFAPFFAPFSFSFPLFCTSFRPGVCRRFCLWLRVLKRRCVYLSGQGCFIFQVFRCLFRSLHLTPLPIYSVCT